MPADILITIVVTAMIQSVFGVGVLLFGTPVLLLLGYDFINALSVLLPISIAINLLQLIKHYQFIDVGFYKQVLLYSIPFVVVFLFYISTAKISINLLVGAFLILVSLKNFFPKIEQYLQQLVKFERSYLGVMGVIHGMTNLGGSLLTAIVHAKGTDKNTTRATVAICYATFAIFQLATLLFIGSHFELSYADNISFLQLGVIIFLLTEEFLYSKIDDKRYGSLFAGFLLISGVLLILK